MTGGNTKEGDSESNAEARLRETSEAIYIGLHRYLTILIFHES